MAFVDPTSRVPYYFFKEIEHGEDVERSAELGYPVPKMVTMICITPHGHKGDPLEFYADEYIDRKFKESRDGRYDPSWVSEFKSGLAAYREGRSIPRSGTPLATWDRLLKSRREQLAVMFPTVEDLAAVPDSNLSTIGLDGRVIRDLARGDIQSKKDLSPVVKELAEANEVIRRQEDAIAALTKRLDNIESQGTAKRVKSAA